MIVSLLVTGVTELNGLADSLRGLFPNHEFACIPSRPGEPHNSFTCNPLPIAQVSPGVRSNIDLLVASAAAEATKTGSRAPDLVVVLDDLELANAHQPEVVVRCFRDGVHAHLEKLRPALRATTAAALRAKVSLHFAAPMIESWLFADPDSLARVGVPMSEAIHQKLEPAFEDFSTDDQAYIQDDCSDCARWKKIMAGPGRVTKSKRRANQPEWCRGHGGVEVRCRHPKRYLAWLCRDENEKKCSTYKETVAAVSLAQLNWGSLISGATMPFVNSMIDDLADALGEQSKLPSDAVFAPSTQRVERREPTLRNL